jgi:hypothetical protein
MAIEEQQINNVWYSNHGSIDSIYYSDGRYIPYEEKIRMWYCWDWRSNFWNDYSIEHLKNKPVQVFIEEFRDKQKIAIGTEIKKVKLIPNHLGQIMTTAERVVPRYFPFGADQVMGLSNIDYNFIDELLAQIGEERYFENGKLLFRKLKKPVMQVQQTLQNLNLC